MPCGELEHRFDVDGRAGQRAGNALLPEDESKGRNGRRFEYNNDHSQATMGSKRIDEAVPVESGIDGDDQ